MLYELHLTDENDLKVLPDYAIEEAKKEARIQGKTGESFGKKRFWSTCENHHNFAWKEIITGRIPSTGSAQRPAGKGVGCGNLSGFDGTSASATSLGKVGTEARFEFSASHACGNGFIEIEMQTTFTRNDIKNVVLKQNGCKFNRREMWDEAPMALQRHPKKSDELPAGIG
ncbi:hypothetical protein FQA39_LY19039 [Lamprigera yunnana]|nr:hypothetical protein FQA39_LY19039 [Lamprigera yunnana]